MVRKPTVTIDDFVKLDVRVGLVAHAEAVPDSKKLIRLSVNLGDEYGVVTILAGLLPYFPEPSALVGNKYLFLANLAPRVMAGVESQGMFLAVDDSENPVPIQVPDHLPLGAYVR